jgi:DNA mismatch repair protein MutS2
MARDGIPVPAQPDGARVDFFGPVLADIGDIQSVDGDLSTFSGHMLVCREVLANSGRNALVLMDELGSGTDPKQGVAIAQALLEALLETGARCAITTHYLELKQLASSDNRFAVGGMQFINGRPTYKLLPGVVGESFALAVAERLSLPEKVIHRATELLDSETRQMGDLIRDMEDQKTVIENQAADLERKRKELDELEVTMRKQTEKLERAQINARRDEAKKFALKLEEKERVLEDILGKLKSDPSKKVVARSWDEIKYVKRDALTEAENIPSVLKRKQKANEAAMAEFAELVPLSELREKPEIKMGDTLVICKNGSFRGKEAQVINVGGKRVNVSVQGMGMTMKLIELALPLKTLSKSKKKEIIKEDSGPKMSKMARQALAQELEAGGNASRGQKQQKGGPVMRLKSNTVDCLGCNFEEARRKCENKFSRTMMSKDPVVFILHGHGTKGILKQKIRDWLKRDKQWVQKWSGADATDGGDAFTKVELKKIQY